MNSHSRINHLVLVSSLVLALAVSAHEPAKPVPAPAPTAPPKSDTASLGMPVFVQNVDPAAAAAVKVVDAFSAAISAAKLEDAAKLLDPQVLVLESGSSERSREQYLGEHAGADVVFMQTAHQQLRYRQAHAEGNLAWVGTESSLSTTKDGKPVLLLSTETMVLRKTPQGWKIVHIHWSSHPAPKS